MRYPAGARTDPKLHQKAGQWVTWQCLLCLPSLVADGWVLISGHGAGDKTFKVNIDGLQLSHHTRLMGRGRVLALDPGRHGGGLYPLAALAAPAALAAGRATG